MKPIFFPFYTV